jgi:hypothetical protein
MNFDYRDETNNSARGPNGQNGSPSRIHSAWPPRLLRYATALAAIVAGALLGSAGLARPW